MANLRRHFNFNTKPSLSQEHFSMSSCKTTFNNFDKLTLMNDICNCLDLCCSYIQALNSLCSAGSSLARNLFYTVREAPAYHNLSLQFLSVWEEVSKATAGASAAVKTETLMLLQEILNSLEMTSNEANMNDIILDSFQTIGSCLCSFIELQAQFSWSTWKSLSKLSKNFTSESLKHSLSLQLKSFEKNPSKIVINTDLISTIKKHYSQLFCKIGIPKISESSRSSERQFHSSVPRETNISTYHFRSDKSQHSVPSESLWSSEVWTSKNSPAYGSKCIGSTAEQAAINVREKDISASSEISFVEDNQLIHVRNKCSAEGSSTHTDLDEVINLLSCGPAQFANKLRNKNLITYPVNEHLSEVIPKDIQSLSDHLQSNQVWPETSDNIKADAFIWRLGDCSSNIVRNSDIDRSHTYEIPDFYKHWECKDGQMWNISSTETGSSSDDVSSHCLDSEFFPTERDKLFNDILRTSKRGCSSGESMPGGLENVSECGEEHVQEIQSKINTWPLKQSINQDF